MQVQDFLFSGGLWLVPVVVGVMLILWRFGSTSLPGLPRRTRLRSLYFGRSLIPVLPLLGIFGTVWGLMETIGYMATADLTASGTMGEVMSRFATALNTTFWGVVGAAANIVLYEMALAPLEAVEDEN